MVFEMRVYLDNSASSRVCPEAVEAMLPYFSEKYGNPSSLHSFGVEAREGIERARIQVARSIGAKPEEIIFTSGGTEGDNLALRGAVGTRKGGIVTTNIEHPAILETCKQVAADAGVSAAFVPVEFDGVVDAEKVAAAVDAGTSVVSVMAVNNEVGTIQPLSEVVSLCKQKNPNALVHTDAVQAVGKIPVDVKKLDLDLLSLASHKFHGPKGVGALYIREGVKLKPAMTGGGHERGLRSGTENVPGIVGMGIAAELSVAHLEDDASRAKRLRDTLIDGLLALPEAYLNGSREKRSAFNANFRFLGVEGESLLLMLDSDGVAGSTGSACSSKKLQASHVLMALGLKKWEAHGSLRLSLSRYTTREEAAYAMEAAKKAVERLRGMSPVWRKIVNEGKSSISDAGEDEHGEHVH